MTRPHATLGKPIYTSDGVQIGKVVSIGTYKGKPQLIGEVGLSLGFGTRLVLVPNDIATVQTDRILLTITSDHVSEMLRADQ